MRTDEFLAQLQNVKNSKEMVDLLVKSSVLEPPLPASFPPLKGTKLACTKNTPWIPAGTRGEPIMWYGPMRGYNSAGIKWYSTPDDINPEQLTKYKIKWSGGKEEEIDKQIHDAYRFVYVY